MSKKNYPKKGLGSYLLPFVMIILLFGTGWYIVQNQVNIDDIKRIFSPPPVAKDEKVSIVYQEGENELKPWSVEKWEALTNNAYLQAGDTLKTGPGGVLVLRFFENSEIRLDEKSEMKIVRVDKNETSGDHLAVELISGQLWRRGTDANTKDADFIITTSRQIIQMNTAAVVDVSTNPDRLRVIGGTLVSNIAERTNGTRKPISQLELTTGDQITLDDLTLDQLKAGDKNIITSLDEAYRQSEWYLWNMEKEEKLGAVVDITKVPEKQREELEKLTEGLVKVTSPTINQKVGSKTTVSGTYDKSVIEKIWVNNQVATLGLEDQWEAVIAFNESQNTITVTAQEKGSEQKKEAVSFEVKVDSVGPALGKITKPEVDSNGNGIITGDTLELVGEVDTDAQKVCVSHNDTSPAYCLKQFTPGAKTYRYLGGVGYGNVISGKNKYTITATDSFGNVSQKTIYLFKDIPKPEEKIQEESTTPTTPEPTSTGIELNKPVITSPDPAQVYETSEASIKITGTVDTRSSSLLVNGKKANYKAGSANFEVNLTLDPGENIVKIQTADAQGNKSKTATLNAIYLEDVKPAADQPVNQ